MLDDFSRAVDWSSEIIGLQVARINVEIEGYGDLSTTPSALQVVLTTRPPNLDLGLSSVPVSFAIGASAAVLEAGADTPGRAIYRASADPGALGIGAGTAAGVLKAATIVRPTEAHLGPGTSDAAFRGGLNGLWSPRGRGVQRAEVDPVTKVPLAGGSAQDESPDARGLMIAGGLEVVGAVIPPFLLPDFTLLSPAISARALVRSQSTVVYYSGHGLYGSRCLAINTAPNDPQGHYACWVKPADLVGPWRGLAIRTLVLAGCSLLSVNLQAAPPTGPGLDWLPLMRSRGGPLEALLGYGATIFAPGPDALQSPGDNPVGNAVAREIAGAISGNSQILPQDWLRINASYRAWNAVAIDGNGVYWSMTKDIPGLTAYTTHQTQL